MIDKLLRQHEQMRDYTNELLALIDRDTPCDLDALCECRWRLARLMLQHLALEERYVLRPLEEDARPYVKLNAMSFRMDLEASHTRYEEYLAHWTRERIEAEWTLYATTLRHLAAFLLERMEREEAQLYPLIKSKANVGIRQPSDRNWAGEAPAIRELIHRVAA